MDLLYRVKTLWAALRGNHYTWPAIDISLSGNRHFHLIGSIHMGSHDMAPLPARLLKNSNKPMRLSSRRMFPPAIPHLPISLPARRWKSVSAKNRCKTCNTLARRWAFLPRCFLLNRCGKLRWFFRRHRRKTGAAGRIWYRLPVIAGSEATT